MPSNIVFTRGSPNASVLCDAQNDAAVTSSFEKFNTLKRRKKAYRLRECKKESITKRIKPCERSIPRPFVKALQNAFHTKPMRMYC